MKYTISILLEADKPVPPALLSAVGIYAAGKAAEALEDKAFVADLIADDMLSPDGAGPYKAVNSLLLGVS